MRQVQDRIFVGGGDRDEQGAAPQVVVEATEGCATAPTFPSFFGSTRTTRNVGTLRSIYCNGDMPWHASRAQDCVRWRRVLRPPAPTGSADRRGRVPRGIAGGQGRPGSA